MPEPKKPKAVARRMLNRLIWIEALCFALLIVFISIGDEWLLPRLNEQGLPWSPNLVAAFIDSLWIVLLFLLALYIQAKYLDKIKLLEGMLAVCANCKKIRDEKGHWSPIEVYIHQRSHADFSHSICPECGPKLYGEVLWKAAGESRDPDPQ